MASSFAVRTGAAARCLCLPFRVHPCKSVNRVRADDAAAAAADAVVQLDNTRSAFGGTEPSVAPSHHHAAGFSLALAPNTDFVAAKRHRLQRRRHVGLE